MKRSLLLALVLFSLLPPTPSMAATGCGAHADSLFAKASVDYQAGKYIYTSADMQEAATDYYACAQHAKSAGDPAKLASYSYFYGESLYVAGEAEAQLKHNVKVKELWSAGIDSLRPLQKSQYLSASQRALTVHAVNVMTPVVKILS
jgi:hypothetical protein